MVRMSQVFVASFAVLAANAFALSAEKDKSLWIESYADALKLSAKTGKPIIADFTGSDWCGWCIKLKAEVFDTPEFNKWAKENVILLELDYPNAKPQSAAIKKQNAELQQKYQIRGYPTILFLNSKGEPIGKSGYMAGGPKPWIQNAEANLKSFKATAATTQADTADKNDTNGAATEASAPQTFTELLAASKTNNQPLLAIIVHTQSSFVTKKVDALMEDASLSSLTSGQMQVAKINTMDASKDEVDAINAFRKQYKIRNTPTQVIAFDAAKDKVVFMSYALPTGRALATRLKSALPDLKPNLRQGASAAAKTDSNSGGSAKSAIMKDLAEAKWMEDYDKALQVASATNRSVVLDFTGSDWCGYCIKLDNEVFKTDAFKQYAAKKLVLVKLDFPRTIPQSDAIKQQNQKLAQQYQIRGYPTLIILNSRGKQAGQMGYQPGGPDPFLKQLSDIVK